MRRWKAPKKLRRLKLIAPGDVLVCGRVSGALSDERLAAACFGFLKLGWLEDARLLAVAAGGDYILVLNLPGAEAAERVRDNFAGAPVAGVELCEAPAGVALSARPFGLVLSKAVGHRVTVLMCRDSDLAEDRLEQLAARMDRDPGGDYVFPDLSPAEYAAVKARQRRKPM